MENKYAALIERLGFERPKPEQSDLSLTEEALQTIEAKLRHRLPADYREFLRDYPGIHFPDAVFQIDFEDEVEDVGFWGFNGSVQEDDLADLYFSFRKNLEGKDESCGLEWYLGLQLLKETKNVGWSEELLPIGYNGNIDCICLALNGLRPGAIFYWRNNPWPNKENLYLVADSFDEFMHLLHRWSESESAGD